VFLQPPSGKEVKVLFSNYVVFVIKLTNRNMITGDEAIVEWNYLLSLFPQETKRKNYKHTPLVNGCHSSQQAAAILTQFLEKLEYYFGEVDKR